VTPSVARRRQQKCIYLRERLTNTSTTFRTERAQALCVPKLVTPDQLRFAGVIPERLTFRPAFSLQ